MASVFKPRGARKYVISYRDERGRWRKKTGATDRSVTERIARDLENRVALRREGVIDPKADGYATHEARPLADHLADFHTYLIDKGNTSKHADLTRTRAARVVAMVKGAKLVDIDAPNASHEARRKADAIVARSLAAARLSDLTADRVQAALAALRSAGRSLGTLNAHLRAIKGFSRWLHRAARRVRDDDLTALGLFNESTDRRHDRRALTGDEAARLVAAAEAGPIVEGMTGHERATLYRVALGTGFRAAELRSLTPASFRLADKPPVIDCQAAYAKNRRKAEQPIPEALAEALAPFLATRRGAGPVFATMPRLKTAAMLRADLAAAGIPYRDASGRVADFHALRATYITELVRGGASVKTAQSLARHASPILTIGRYAHAALHDQTAALETLPDLTPTAPRHEAATLAATGTDPTPGATAGATADDEGNPKPLTLLMLTSTSERIANPLFPGSNPGGASGPN